MTTEYRRTSNNQTKTNVHTVFYSLRPADCSNKRLRVSFASFQRINLPDKRVNKTAATVDELCDC